MNWVIGLLHYGILLVRVLFLLIRTLDFGRCMILGLSGESIMDIFNKTNFENSVQKCLTT